MTSILIPREALDPFDPTNLLPLLRAEAFPLEVVK